MSIRKNDYPLRYYFHNLCTNYIVVDLNFTNIRHLVYEKRRKNYFSLLPFLCVSISSVIDMGWNTVKQYKRLQEQMKLIADEYYKLARTRGDNEELWTQDAQQLIHKKNAVESEIQWYQGEIQANRKAIEEVVAEFKQANEQVLDQGKNYTARLCLPGNRKSSSRARRKS